MNAFGRTKSNRERLKLKSFLKRTLSIFKIPKIKNLKYENSKLNGIIGSGSSKMARRHKYFGIRYGHTIYTYEVKHVRKNGRVCNRVITFNKSQLIGKVYWEYGCMCRIIRKVA